MQENFDLVLFPNSPFIPPVTIQAAYRIINLVQTEDYHPLIAISKEVRDVFGEHLQFLDSEMNWIVEKFGVSQEDLDDYSFGLLVPVTLIIAAEMARYNRLENVLNLYFPLSDEQFFVELRNYGHSQLTPVSELLNFDSPDPMVSATPVFDHCAFEVLSFGYWYQVGLEAGRRTFQQFAQLH
jgi:hypothetical protein